MHQLGTGRQSRGVRLHVLHPHPLGVVLKLSKNLILQWVGALCIEARVPDVPVSHMISTILDTSSGFKRISSNGVAKHVHVSGVDSCCLSIVSNLSTLRPE